MARDIFLMMTSKNPRLREPLRDHFYLLLSEVLEEDYRLVTMENRLSAEKVFFYDTRKLLPSWRRVDL